MTQTSRGKRMGGMDGGMDKRMGGCRDTERERDRRVRRGVVLFVVTIVVALSSLVAYGFLITMQGENKASRTAADQRQVAQVGASGEEFVAVWLQAARAERRSLAESSGNAIFSQPVTEPTLTANAKSAGRFHIVLPAVDNRRDLYGPPNTTSNSRPDATNPTGFGTTNSILPFEYGVLNESAKLHLRTLLEWDAIWPGAGRNALMQLPRMNESIADAILDWIDEDDSPREFGAEDEYYVSLTPSMHALNDVPESLDDLLQVRGVTPASLLGVPSAFRAPMEDAFTDRSSSNSALTNSRSDGSYSTTNTYDTPHPWIEFLTTYSAERNVAFDGSPRININNPDLTVMHRELLSFFPQGVADFVVLSRQYGLTEVSPVNVQTTVGVEIEWNEPPIYLFGSTADLIDAFVAIPPKKSGISSSGDPRYVGSPFATLRDANPELDPWLDRLTVHQSRSLVGRLNLIAADPVVVAAVPFPDSSVAAQVLALRETLGQNASTVPGTSWLLTEGLLEREHFLKLSRFLTTGGDVVRFQVVATHPHGPVVDRFEVILDGTIENTQRVYFRDLRRAGTPQLFDRFRRPSNSYSPQTSPAAIQAR